MATMSNGHSLQTFATSCHKAPLDPRTGNVTNYGRYGNGLGASMDDFAVHGKTISAGEIARLEVLDPSLDPVPRSLPIDLTRLDGGENRIETLHAELSELDNETFYHRLQELKSDHSKTLQMYEHLYHEKVQQKNPQQLQQAPMPMAATMPPSSHSMHQFQSQAPVAQHPQSHTLGFNYLLSDTQPVNEGAETFRRTLDYINNDMDGKWFASKEDHVRDMSAKPPTGRPPSAASRQSSVTSQQQLRLSRSGGWISSSEDEEVAAISSRGCKTKKETVNSAIRIRERPSSAQGRIEDMWEDFELDEYMPHVRLARSNSFSRLESESNARTKKGRKQADTWKHRVTIPQPFQMTLRQENQPLQKPRSLQRWEEEQRELEMREEAECSRKFKAQPAPAHIYVPLFEEIMEQKETRRRMVAEEKRELTKTKVKPFNFTVREEKKTEVKMMKTVKNRPMSAPARDKKFKANPVPEYIYDDCISDRFAEDEEFRKIKIQMRAEEMLQHSSLPPNMAKREREKEVRKQLKMGSGKKKSSTAPAKPSFQPKIKGDVPDFEEMHRKFHRSMQVKKYSKEPTVVQPFNLRAKGATKSSRDGVLADMSRDEEQLKETRWPYKNPRAKPMRNYNDSTATLDSIPTRLTKSASLRTSASREMLHQLTAREQAELEREKEKQQKEKLLRRSIAAKAAANGALLSSRGAEKDRSKSEGDRQRRQEYQQQLQEMTQRVNNRPLLFERESQINARKAAEKRYESTLKSHGVSRDLVSHQSSRAPRSNDTYGLSDDDDDVSEVRSRSRADEPMYGSDKFESHHSGDEGSRQDRTYSCDDFSDEQ